MVDVIFAPSVYAWLFTKIRLVFTGCCCIAIARYPGFAIFSFTHRYIWHSLSFNYTNIQILALTYYLVF